MSGYLFHKLSVPSRLFFRLYLLVLCMTLRFATAADLDSDGIPDAFEDELLQRFAPIVKTDQLNTTPSQFRAVPVSASWFVSHTDLAQELRGPGITLRRELLVNPTPVSVLIFCLTNDFSERPVGNPPSTIYLDFRDENAKWGNSPTDPTSWPDAIARKRGVYGRVWRPWPDRYPDLYSVQYYMLFTWNESGDCLYSNSFRHDGDVMCVDFCVDISAAGGPAIIHGIYHVHGKQIFVTRDALNFQDGHPLVFLERGTNEAWPNAGTDGTAGWPRNDGFAISGYVCGSTVGPEFEYCCVRQHQGEGNIYATANVPNIGEAPWPNGASISERAFLPFGDLDCQLFLFYPGAWGVRADPPEGPAFQSKMWRREVSGPWAAFGEFATHDVLHPDLEAFSLLRSGRMVGTNYVLYNFLPICDVRVAGANEQRGLPSKPYVTVTQGVEKVATYGVLRIGQGTYSESMEITKPMQIESAGGLVTIGP